MIKNVVLSEQREKKLLTKNYIMVFITRETLKSGEECLYINIPNDHQSSIMSQLFLEALCETKSQIYKIKDLGEHFEIHLNENHSTINQIANYINSNI